MNWARQELGDDIQRTYDDTGKWNGWENPAGDKVYWGHGDWYQGQGASTYPHLNYDIDGIQGHLFLEDKIRNNNMWDDFVEEMGVD
ncbi:hypothetical protein KFU94_12860 [Chloroflexi bacterium TSY]|nr:hypothetical protein [Chloroflexi bacterium TSY]